MKDKYIYSYVIILVILVALAKNQPCNGTGININITNIYSGMRNIEVVYNGSSAFVFWDSPLSSNATLNISGAWYSNNGSLMQLIFLGYDDDFQQVTSPPGRETVRSSYLDDEIRAISFAQKDNAYNNFQIIVYPRSLKYPVYFALLLVKRGYNDKNGTCIETCPDPYQIKLYKDEYGVQDPL